MYAYFIDLREFFLAALAFFFYQNLVVGGYFDTLSQCFITRWNSLDFLNEAEIVRILEKKNHKVSTQKQCLVHVLIK